MNWVRDHSRVFYFDNGSDDPIDGDFFIRSADWMYRNLSKRIEVAPPVRSSPGKARLWEVLDACLRDRRQAWELDAQGRYRRLSPGIDGEGPEVVGNHRVLMRLNQDRAGASSGSLRSTS